MYHGLQVPGEGAKERPVRVHVPSHTGAAPSARETQASVPGNPGTTPSITAAIVETAHHQSPSAESLTDVSAVPAIGDSVHYKESELMRMTANALEAAASHTRQASVGAAEATGQLGISSDGRYPVLSSLMFPQPELPAPPWPLRERSQSQPASSLSALPTFPITEEGSDSAPTSPSNPQDLPTPPSDAPQISFVQVDGSVGSSDSAVSFRHMLVGPSDASTDMTASHEGATIADDVVNGVDDTAGPSNASLPSLPSSSDTGSPRTDQDIAAAAVWHSTATGKDQAPANRPESPTTLSKRRSSRSGSKQLQTISEDGNEES